MLTNEQLEIIRRFAKEYNVKEIYLFGSSLEDSEKANDIDLGVLGIEPKNFFSFYGDLFMELDKPVDLIDLSKKFKFTSYILERGVKIYPEIDIEKLLNLSTENEKIKSSWHKFIHETYGSLADNPITRGDQGQYEIRENIE